VRGVMRQTSVLGAAAIAAALLTGTSVIATSASAQASFVAERGSTPLIDALNGLGNTSRVLVIGAHPDDEDTQLIAWLARGRHVETAYLSLTRGDGGQNLIGNELGEALGVIRTQELLAARKIDGGRQFFTRAFDFGFSKNAEETLQHWPKDTIMGDVVRVVRAFRPQVIVAIFSGTPRDGHGHHQVSGILAREAYDASGDTVRFPTGEYGLPWTASKFYRRVRTQDASPTTRINVGEYDAVTGRSYAEVAADSRSQHKSQGFGVLQQKGAIIDVLGLEGSRVTDIKNIAAETGLFAGIDTTWARLEQLTPRADVKAEIDSAGAAFVQARALYNENNPTPSIEPLARAIRLLRAARDASGLRPPRLMNLDEGHTASRLVDAANHDLTLRGDATHWTAPTTPTANPELWNALDINEKRAEKALLLASGVAIEAFAPRTTLAAVDPLKRSVPDTMGVNVAVYNRGRLPIRFTSALAPMGTDYLAAHPIDPDSTYRFALKARSRAITTQWWRNPARKDAIFLAPLDSRDDAQRAEETELDAHVRLVVANTALDVTVPILNRVADPVKGELLLRTATVPGITIGLDHSMEYIRANVPVVREVHVNILSAYTAPETVHVSLALPKGLTADSATRIRVLTPESPGQTVVFRVKGTVAPGLLQITAVAIHDGAPALTGYYTINYNHIPTERMYSPSSMWLQSVVVAKPAARLRVAYIPGVGDAGSDALAQLDVDVERIAPDAVGVTDFSKFTAVIVGPRAYASNKVLVANNRRLLDYAKKGGTLIVQYGQTEMMKPGIMPYPIQLSRTAERVTDETAPVTVLQPNAKILNSPNKIGPADWAGWVQERATYMPTTFDKNYSPVLQMNDPGEAPNKAGLLVARYGRGTYVYVTLALFRQLPAGVPGAARLLMNLISTISASAMPPVE
jgi:LmbE family N-acetylglucosaminyl deacetylase